MKKISKIILPVLASFVATCLTSCIGLPKFSESAIEKFQHADGLPTDSVVFYGFLPQNSSVTFTEISDGKKISPDVQTGIERPITDSSGIWISTPVKPGSTYMISYICGQEQGGAYAGVDYSLGSPRNVMKMETIKWDQTFTEDQQFFVIKIPEEPGFYCFGMYFGSDIMRNAVAGKGTVIYDQNNITEFWGKNAAQIMVNGLTCIQSAYAGTPWEEAASIEMKKFSK